MQTTIRRITLEDAATLSVLASQTFYDTFTGTCTEEDMNGFLHEYYRIEQVQKELADATDYYFFIELNGIAIGYLRLQEDYTNLPLMQQWKALELKRLYVSKEYHGMGIAHQLMQFALDFANENKYEVIWLGVWEYNYRAQKFYAKYGFENTGHSHPFPIGNTPQTDLWWWKFLSIS